jgi:hypothetical protein
MTDKMKLLQDYAEASDNLWLLHKLQELQSEIDLNIPIANIKTEDSNIIAGVDFSDSIKQFNNL